MPKLWDDSIDSHRRAVREATIDATAALVAEHGVRAVTMSQIAEKTGIGRATLYKYFQDVDGILVAWHERQIHRHLEQLSRLRDQAGNVNERLRAVLEAYAFIQHELAAHGGALSAALHGGDHVDRAQQQLREFMGELLAEAAAAGAVRDDVPASELASYCLHATAAAGGLPSKAAVRRLVLVTLDGLRRSP